MIIIEMVIGRGEVKVQYPLNDIIAILIRINASPSRLVNIVIILLPAAAGVW